MVVVLAAADQPEQFIDRIGRYAVVGCNTGNELLQSIVADAAFGKAENAKWTQLIRERKLQND